MAGATAKTSWMTVALLLSTLILPPGLSRAQVSTGNYRKTTTVGINNDPATVRTVDDWIPSGSVAPTKIESKRERSSDTMLKPVTVVLASEIELGHQVYETKGRHTAPRNVVLVADTIRITGPVTFDLSGNDVDASSKNGITLLDRSGGDLILLARNFVCEANGKLIFRSSGGDAESAGSTERCSSSSAGLCRRNRATCDVVHGTDGSSSEVCRWDSISSASACSGTVGIWTTVGSRYAKNHPDAVHRGKAGACITDVANIVSNRESSTRRAAPGGSGGNLVIAAERFSYGAGLHEPEAFRDLGCIEVNAEGGAGGGSAKPGTVRLYDSMKEAAAELQQEGRRPYGVPVASHSANFAVSKWVTTLLDDAITGVQVAGLTAGKIEAARRLRQAISLSDWNKYPVLPEHRPAFEEHVRDLQELKDRYQNALWTTSRSLQSPSGIPLQVDLYTEGGELRTRVAPTLGMVRSRVLGGRNVIGLLEFNPEKPDLVRMEFEVELTVDPWLEGLLAAELTAEGDEYAGVFSNWALTGHEISEQGVRESSVEVSGEKVHISLTVDAARVSLIMAKLASSKGLPLTFDWQYRNDLNLRGVWSGPGLSLQRRTDPGIELDEDGRATNRSNVDLTIEYVRIGDDFLPLNLVLHPGETEAVLPAGADPAQATIPAAAVAYSGVDPFRFEGDFHIINGEELVEQITLTNRLGLNPERGGALEYVEVDLTYIVGDDDSSYEVPAGPYRLSSRDTTGSEITVSFLKPERALRQILVSGTAYYENNSSQTLTTTSFTDLTIKITEAMLP